MMKRVTKPERETSRSSFRPQQQSRFAPRPFPAHQPEHEAPSGEPLFSYNLLNLPAYPRETVQPKLRLGPVGDRYEQEADRVARRVVETISSPEQNSVQRQEDLEDEDELDLEEDAELRRKVAGLAPVAGGADVGPDLESAIRGARGQWQPLSDGVRQPMERAFGTDFGRVRLHTDGQADRLNRSIQARAFTTGQDIFLRQGEYRPESSQGQRLLAHELTHVVQQNGGAVQRAQMQAAGRVLQAKEEATPNRTGMPDHLKSGLENLSGMDLSGVRVQYSSPKPAQLNALAYTRGQEIHVAPGQERHLPHEGWHAVQQMQGRVKPTMLMEGTPVNDDSGLEKEADVMGSKAIQMKTGICQECRPDNHIFAKALEKDWVKSQHEPTADLTPFSLKSGKVVQCHWHKNWVDLTNSEKNERTTVNGGNAQKVYVGATRGTLSLELQAGLTLAQANPSAAPPNPAWLDAKYNRSPSELNVPIYNGKDKKQFGTKWANGYNNSDGKLPGVAGAGGYSEYYAEPSPNAKDNMELTQQKFGKNRILKQTNVAGKTYWWASNDHYNNVTYITDA